MRNVLLIVYFILLSVGCIDNKSTQKTIRDKVDLTKTFTGIEQEGDTVKIELFVENFITNLNDYDEKELSEKFNYPIAMFEFSFKSKEEFIQQWHLDDRLKNYLSLDIYDENDQYIGRSDIENTKIFYLKGKKSVAQFGIGSGLIFNVDKIKNELKLSKLDVAD